MILVRIIRIRKDVIIDFLFSMRNEGVCVFYYRLIIADGGLVVFNGNEGLDIVKFI